MEEQWKEDVLLQLKQRNQASQSIRTLVRKCTKPICLDSLFLDNMTTEATRQAQAKNLQLERHTEKLTLDVEELRRAGPSSGVTAEQLNDIYGKIFAQAEEISALTEALKAPQEKIAGLHQTIYDKDGEIRKMTEKKEESTITLGVLRSSLLELQVPKIS